MNEVLEYLKNCKTFYLATIDGDQPRVRPFGAVCECKGKLYITTANNKQVYKQIMNNPKIGICGMYNNTWIRIEAQAIKDSDISVKEKMLNDHPSLKNMYSVNDGIFEVLYLKDATATISSFTSEPKIIKF